MFRADHFSVRKRTGVQESVLNLRMGLGTEAIEAVVVDGNRRDEHKTYGLWLNPSGNAVEALQKAL